jgi:hypothetical protein
MTCPFTKLATVSAFAICLAACGSGSGGGGHVASTPTPTPTPSPTPTPTPTPTPAGHTVNIFPNPQPETYASVGVAGGFSTADSDQAHIRYNAGGYYELQVPGKDWARLVFPSNVVPQNPDTFNYFVTNNGGFLAIGVSRLDGYRYSEWGHWASPESGGSIAFGSATPSGSVPVTGAAAFHGEVDGASDILQDDFLVGGKVLVAVTGTVDLNFDFADGTLGGSMSLRTDPYVGPVDLGTFAFRDTVYSTGALTYSGAFQTSAAGRNFFLGRFTGPHAEETIGAWALPFHYGPDGQAHQAVGAWIAKRP